MQLSKLWECEATNAQKLLSQSEKVAKCNFKSKVNYMNNFLSNEMNSFLQCRRQIFTCLSFFAEKVILELNCTKALLWLLRTPILCLVQTKQIMRMRGHKCSKLLSQSEKVAKCNFKSKVNYMKNFFLMKWTVFCKSRFSRVWAFLQKSHFRA